ncbi:MAG TPA: glycoside hydrolase family 43 protein [Acidimicrobiales bacterium]
MTALLPARARTAAGGVRLTPRRRHVTHLAIATVVVLAGLAWPAGAKLAPAITARLDTPPASGPVREASPPPEVQQRPAGPPPTVPPARRLDPAPPSDGRDAPDPFILADHDRYVLYSTQVGFHNVPVATSADLRHWSPPTDALPQLPEWATWGRTWAPGVTRLGDRYLLYFTARHRAAGRQCIGVATSPTATGPFTPTDTVPLVCQTHLGGSIDPNPYVDADGTAYLLWKADSNAIDQPSTLYAQRLTPDGTGLTGQSTALVTSGAAWEQPLIENPALVATGRSYVLFYSGGWYDTARYATGYATCHTPLGPCTKATAEAPLLASEGDQAGPGGACVLSGPAGDDWLAYHAWTPDAIGYDAGGARSLHFAPLAWPNGQPAVTR